MFVGWSLAMQKPMGGNLFADENEHQCFDLQWLFVVWDFPYSCHFSVDFWRFLSIIII